MQCHYHTSLWSTAHPGGMLAEALATLSQDDHIRIVDVFNLHRDKLDISAFGKAINGNEPNKMNLPPIKPLTRVSPSRYTAMKNCLLREVWTASGNEPLLPASPLAELGTVIHQLLEAAGRGRLDAGMIESHRYLG